MMGAIGLFGDRAGRRDPRSERGSAVIMALILILLILGLAGVAFSFFRFSREKAVRPFQASGAAGAADYGLQHALSALQKKAAGGAASDPAMAFFFWGGDLNGDGIPAQDGEVDWNRNGKLDVSPVTGRKTLEDADGNGIWNRPDGILEGPPGNLSDEDTGVDGLLDFMEPGYDPLTKPDPNQDNYHPVFHPSGTEGNGRFDPGEPDNGDGRFDTVEDGSRWIRWGRECKHYEGQPRRGGSGY
ncbi:MAG: hypothetical protein MPW14_25565 (plasmid) [Candidatus Manganitrophus sp.]|nr:MAG: hypothetical protein MPW14_25565 [Candidatus Manganitrophus sp.]